MLSQRLDLREDNNKKFDSRVLVLMLSRQCNIYCSHCIVNWWPKNKDKMTKETIYNAISDASNLWFTQILLYWWEPFLQINNLLPYGIEEGLKKWMVVQINTNWYWWKSENIAEKYFEKIQKIAQTKNGMVIISLSVDSYHQKIPPKSISNLIRIFRLSNYDNIRLWINTFSGEESNEKGFRWALEKVYLQLSEKDIFLIQDNKKGEFIYPAKKEEFIHFCEENFPKILEKLKTNKNLSKEDIQRTIRILITKQELMARKFDIWEWEKPYIIFLEKKKIITLNIFGWVTKAWKSKVWEKTELYPDDFDWKYNSLIIWSNNKVYMYPSQIAEDIGWIPYESWDLLNIIKQVGQSIEALVRK